MEKNVRGAGAHVVPRVRRRALAIAMFAAVGVAMLMRPLVAADIPSRIVSTSPSITETLFALQLGDRVVGVSTFCRYPPQVRALPKVGTFVKPEPETIARLSPDLVFVHSGPSSIASQLTALGIRTQVLDPGTLPSVYSTIQLISSAANVPERGDALVREIQQSLDRVKAAVAGRPRKRVLIIIGRRTGTLTNMVAVGPGSYLHDLIAIAGGTNVMDQAPVAYPRISMETAITAAPDVLIDIGEMGESPADSERRRQIVESLWANQRLVKAVRDGAVHVAYDEYFVTPGPRVVDAASAIARWLHGIQPQ